ncbi:MAG: DUF4838 domain-containing protein [Lentisphaeria bacterium]|nr:DUF4838 domain-containing protein [Lentisphaeria bacterium]
MKRNIVFLSSFVALLPLLAPGFDLVRDGKALTGITRKSEEKGAVLAVQELSEYVRKVTSADLSGLKDGKVVIGTVKSEGIPSSIVEELKKNPSDEAFFLGAKDGKYYIVGQNGVAAYYGALEVIGRFLGVHWYYPGEKGERYKAKKDVTLPDEGKVCSPVFSRRVLNSVSSTGLCPQGRIWAARNRIQSPSQSSKATLETSRDFFEARMLMDRVLRGGHETFTIPLSPKKYAKTHPEYFALVDGKRRTEGKMLHYCLSNPEVQKKVYEFILEERKKYGEGFTFNFGCVDAYTNWCECPECRKMDRSEALQVSRRFHVFAQKVSKMVWDKYPDAKLSQWAYWNYRDYPEGLELDPRTVIYFCSTQRCYAHALEDPSCKRNAECLERIKKWMKVCRKIHIYEYSLAVDCAYQPYAEVMLQDLRLYRKLGLMGRKEEMVYPDASYYTRAKTQGVWYTKNLMASRWQFWYLFGKGTWDPDFDFEKAVAEAEEDFYGKLYPAMKKYQDLRRKLWKETPGCVGFPFADQRTPRVLQKPGAKEELLGYLAEAQQLAGNDPELRKMVEFEKGALENYWIKPNERYKRSLSRTANAPMVKTPPKIDGDGKDAAWGNACYITDFRDTFGKKEPMPSELATSVGILSDRENLYFLLQAKEPFVRELVLKGTESDKNVWGDDAFEIFLAPPNNSQKYYQFVVNAKGVLQEVEQPGSNMKVSFGATAKAGIGKDGFVVELKIPVRKLEGAFGEGAMWKFHAARNYRVGKSSRQKNFSLDGTAYHALVDYRTLTIGKPVIGNGSFEDGIDPKTSRPKFWGYQGKNTDKIKLVKESGNTAIYLPQEAVLSQILYGKYFRPREPVKVALTFKARGKGKLMVINARFDQILDKKGKPANRFLAGKAQILGNIPLTDKETIHNMEYTIQPLEFSQLRFRVIGKGSECILDDVSARSAD